MTARTPPPLAGRVLRALEGDPTGRSPPHALVYFLLALIALNLVAVILESVDALRQAYAGWFDAFEIFSLVVFTGEYAIRVWAITSDARYARPLAGRLRFAATPMALVDLLSILPSYLAIFTPFGADLRILRALRLFRLLRVLKLGRYSVAVQAFAVVIRERRNDLAVALGTTLLLLVVSSSVMYLAERDAQPDKFASIPHAMWWAIITLTTIGYGDVFPVTTIGKLFGALTALLGVGIVALPTAMLAAGFQEQMARRRAAKEERCPHCGKDVHAPPDGVSLNVEGPAPAERRRV